MTCLLLLKRIDRGAAAAAEALLLPACLGAACLAILAPAAREETAQFMFTKRERETV